mgnify:FL=1|jgi:hypothetical protein
MPEQLQLNFEGHPLTEEEKAIWDIVAARSGKGSEILGPEIARRTGIDYTRVRAVIAHLINEHHKLIGSNGKGYYVPVTPSEVAEVTKSLRHRGIMILVRAAQLQKTSLVDIWNQTYLEFERELHETNR